MKHVYGVLLPLFLAFSASCSEAIDPFLDGTDPALWGETTIIEGDWASTGMGGSPCVLETPVFSTSDTLAKLQFTFRGSTFEYIDRRYNGCEDPGDVMYHYVINGTFTLADGTIRLKVKSMTITLGETAYNTLIFMPPQVWWGIHAANWSLNKAEDIAGKEPNSGMAAYRSPAVGDVMPGIYELNGNKLLLGFDKTPADGYAAPAGAIEYDRR